MEEDKWPWIGFCVCVMTAGACVVLVTVRGCVSDRPDCWGGVYNADEHHTCQGARVMLVERGGKRYAVCSCEAAAPSADAGVDAAVER